MHAAKEEVLPRKRCNDLPFARAVGARMRDFRLERGLSLAQLYTRGGPTPSQMSSIERGKVDFTTDTIRCVAAGLGVRPWQLLTDDDELASLDLGEAKRILFAMPELQLDEPKRSPERAKSWHWKKARKGG